MVVVTDASHTPIPPARWVLYEAAVVDAVALLRPPDESWNVTIVETDPMLRFDFVRGVEAPRTLMMEITLDDDELLMDVCKFVWTYWPIDESAL